jgi:hypothetical protein
MKSLPLRVLHTGTEEPIRETRELRAGLLTALYEDGSLRHIRWGAREILRRIYVAVRDRHWGTVPATLRNVSVDSSLESFDIAFTAECRRGEIHFVWKGSIKGDAKGTIVFSMDGEALSTFHRNRIGICVLHPIKECAGRPSIVERTNGSVTRGSFPRYIWAQQPFLDIKAISHEVAPGVRARVAFQGDTFEMEDQRNWGDASYKTYSTPLRLPFPVEVAKGTKVSQSVTLTVEGATVASRIIPSTIPVSIGAAPMCELPRIGLCCASHGKSLSPLETDLLKRLHLAYLRLDLAPSSPTCDADLQRAAAEARALDLPLELALHLTDAAEAELQTLIPKIVRINVPLAGWLIFHKAEKSTSKKWVQIAREKLIPFHPEVLLGAGTNAYFVEINRGHPPKDIELLSYSLNPQVHASDNMTIVENLEGMEATVESARLIGEDHPLAIGPVTLRPRFNPDAAGPEPETGPGDLPARVDSRQLSLFGAAWTVGTLKALAKPGVHSLTYFETTGRLGVMEREKDPPLHRSFPSMPGWVFPLYHVLADAGEFAGAGVLPWTSGNDLVIGGIGLIKGNRTRVLLSNLTEQVQKVRLACPLFKGEVQVKRLDETNATTAMQTPESFRSEPGVAASGQPLEIDLQPYSFCRVDG